MNLPVTTPTKGLTEKEVAQLRKKYGLNRLESGQKNAFLNSLWHIAQEPMFILLAVACILYFFLGDLSEALMMLLSIGFVAGIEIFQETKSERALEALRRFSAAKTKVLRDDQWMEIDAELLVPGDIVSVSEGERIPADGILLRLNDLFVDESVLTGESLPVEKTVHPSESMDNYILSPNRVFQGTNISAGKGIMRVEAVGAATEFGKLGKTLESIEKSDTPLQRQISRFVRQMGIFGVLAFLFVFGLNMVQQHDFWKAVLFSLTVAMALIPEEIPVAFSTFMGLGAWRMIKHGILAKQPKTVESLGSATVICLDKTGTITENKMEVGEVRDFSGKNRTLVIAGFASEPDPIDAMERAIDKKLSMDSPGYDKGFELVKEYALSGTPPMMTHVWAKKSGETVVAAKGAVERIVEVCKLSETEIANIFRTARESAQKGYRVLAVAGAECSQGDYPARQEDFQWHFEGLVAFYDPPKPNAERVFRELHRAGIRVVMITGDHPETAKNIARATGLGGELSTLTGREVADMDEKTLREKVGQTAVFARMFPEAKLRVVEALKQNGETVAMSGDGVNDGPALKAAQIGVAMGKKGTEIAKTAASLVLLSDNLHGLVTAVKMGRRIYNNLRKAIRYIISIHIPIILVVLVPLLLGWPYPHILLPLHVIFLELVMDPIAAVAFENEPAEKNIMEKPPRDGKASLFSWGEIGISVFQGAAIALGVLAVYQYALSLGKTEDGIRSWVFATMVFSNVFLTLANRSFDYTIVRTLFYKNKSLPFILFASLVMLAAVLYIPSVANLFRLVPLSANELGICALIAFFSVIWFEGYKGVRQWGMK